MIKKTLLALGVVALGLWTGVSSPLLWADEGHGSAEVEEAVHYEVVMGEYFFQVEGQAPGEALVLTPGRRVQLSFVNRGALFHEAMFGHEVDGDHGYHENFFEGVGLKVEHEMAMGEHHRAMELEVAGLGEIELDPEMGMTVTFTVPERYAGRSFEIGCFVEGHYDAGMKLPLIVSGEAADHEEEANHEDEGDEHGEDGHGHEEDEHHDEADQDGDGVPDDEDYCPTYPGDPLTNGC